MVDIYLMDQATTGGKKQHQERAAFLISGHIRASGVLWFKYDLDENLLSRWFHEIGIPEIIV